MRYLSILILSGSVALPVCAQTTITSQDMFNAIGQYYRVYTNYSGTEVSVSTADYGNPGGPQLWDFTDGPDDRILDFDYVDVADGSHNGDFPLAAMAERKTDSISGDQAWMYLTQDAGFGRINFGFYDELFCSLQPSTPFQPEMVDFPDPITFGSSWSASTTFYTQMFSLGQWYPTRIIYNAQCTADGYGLINLENLGFGECLRVQEVASYDIAVDLFGDGTYYSLEVDYLRTYYWLMEDHGIAAQISSRQLANSAPPQNFTLASSYVRMFETNHPSGDLPPEAVNDLAITWDSNTVLLSWTPAAYASEYRVEYSDTPEFITTTELGTTATNYLLDWDVSTVPLRFYRVISIN
ncbi:MAG: hypothetical protein ISR91_07675 [Candidatus Delongbacteria bacterium]|nr:hypothetical protein [Candidatus Delongbacteria bacterium]